MPSLAHAAEVAVLSAVLLGTSAPSPFDAALARIDMELARAASLMLLGNHVPGSYLGDTAPASTMCSACKCGGFHPDDLRDGVCGECREVA